MMNSVLQSMPIIAIALMVVGLGVFAVKMLDRELEKEHEEHHHHRHA